MKRAIQHFMKARAFAAGFGDVVNEINEEISKAESIRDQILHQKNENMGKDLIKSIQDKAAKQGGDWAARFERLESAMQDQTLQLIELRSQISEKDLELLRQKQLAPPSTVSKSIKGRSKRGLTPDQDKIFSAIREVEIKLRNIIEGNLKLIDGERWLEKALRQDDALKIRKRWQKGHELDPNHRLVDELDFDHYSQIINGHQYRDLFKELFADKYEIITKMIESVREIRNNAFHHKWNQLDIEDAIETIQFLNNRLRKIPSIQ